MRTFIIILLSLLSAFTSMAAPKTFSVMNVEDGTVYRPTNFWTANSNAINAVIKHPESSSTTVTTNGIGTTNVTIYNSLIVIGQTTNTGSLWFHGDGDWVIGGVSTNRPNAIRLKSSLAVGTNISIGINSSSLRNLSNEGTLSTSNTWSKNLIVTNIVRFIAGADSGAVLKSDSSGNGTWSKDLSIDSLVLRTSFRLTNGADVGKVLMSDASGNGSWIELTNGLTSLLTGSLSSYVRTNGGAPYVTNLNASELRSGLVPQTVLSNVWTGLTFNPRNSITLANGNNSDVSLGGKTFCRVAGPSSTFTICGLAGGFDGRRVLIENDTGHDMTIENQSGTDATTANRILTGEGASVVITNTPGFVEFIYDIDEARWAIIHRSN